MDSYEFRRLNNFEKFLRKKVLNFPFSYCFMNLYYDLTDTVITFDWINIVV